ncbi:unnamed protein product [Closterium sp. Naga37s-1]|nr:unnamed protein product [Closterium sp. Naga37s-1]
MTLLGGPRRGYVPVRRRNPSGGLQSSRQISPSDGTRHRQLRDRDRQAEEEDGEAGMTEAGVTEAGQSKTSPDLYYNGGPVIADPVVYLIYYGTWPENSGAAIIDNFVQSLGGNASRQGGPRGESSVSGWWAITTHYFMTRADRKLAYVTPKPSSANACFPSALPFLLPSAFLLRSAFPPPLCLPCSSCCRLHIKHQERLKSVADQPSSDNALFSLRPAFPPPLSLPSSSCCRLRIKITTFPASPPAQVPSPLHFSPPPPRRYHSFSPSSPPLLSSPVFLWSLTAMWARHDRPTGCRTTQSLPPETQSKEKGMRLVVDRNVGKANFVDRNVGKANRLPSDPNGIYIVVTSADVDVWEFSRCSYCGWHAQMMDMRTGSPIAYAFVGHHSLCCQYSNSSFNGLPAIDSMASTIAHEITEAADWLLGLPAIDSMVSTIAHEITEAAADPSCLLNPRISLPPPCPSNPTPSHPGRSSPNGLPAIDSMVSTIAHETTEATTDSSPNGMPAIDSMLCRPKLSRPKLCCPKLCRSKLRCSKLCCPKLCRPKLRCSKLCRPELCRPKLCCP